MRYGTKCAEGERSDNKAELDVAHLKILEAFEAVQAFMDEKCCVEKSSNPEFVPIVEKHRQIWLVDPLFGVLQTLLTYAILL